MHMNHDPRATAVYKYPSSNISHTLTTFTLNTLNKTYKFPNILITNDIKKSIDGLYTFNRIQNTLYYDHIRIDGCQGIIEEANRYYKIILNEKGTFIHEYDISILTDFIKTKILQNNKLSLRLFSNEELIEILECHLFDFKWIFFGNEYVKFGSEKTKLFYNKDYIDLPFMGEVLDEDLTKNIHFTKYNNLLCLYDTNKRYLFERDKSILHTFQNYRIYAKKKIENPFQVTILNKNTDFVNITYKSVFYEVNTYKIDNLVLIANSQGIHLLLNHLIVFKEVNNLININAERLEYTIYDNRTHELIDYSIIPLLSMGLLYEEYDIQEDKIIINKIEYKISSLVLLENSIIQVSNNKELKELFYKKLKIKQEIFLKQQNLEMIYNYNNLLLRCFKVTKDPELFGLIKETEFDILNQKNNVVINFLNELINNHKEDILLNFLLQNSNVLMLQDIKKFLVKQNCFYLSDLLGKKVRLVNNKSPDDIKELCIERIKKLEKFYISKWCFRK